MTWDILTAEILRPHLVIIILFAILFFIPVIQLILYPLPIRVRPIVFCSSLAGRWECATGWFRDWIGVPYLVGVIVWHIYQLWPLAKIYTLNAHTILVLGATLLIIINEIARGVRKRNLMALLECVLASRAMQPSEFFSYFYAAHGPIRHRLPLWPRTAIDPVHIDARSSHTKSKPTIWPSMRALGSIMNVMKLIVLADKRRGRNYACSVASNLVVILSAKITHLAQLEFTIEGINKLRELTRPTIYCFNHTSALDFNLIPLFMLAHRDASGANMPLFPTFMLAKDHFLKNPILHRVIGIGRVAEILGMVFVERTRSTRATAEEAVNCSVEALLEGRAPLAIYPQGSRARPTKNLDGTRIDAGYYTVGSHTRLARDGGHLKKGAAFIATNAALELQQQGLENQINIVPVVFIGAGTALPRKYMKVQQGTSVMMRVGNPIIVTTNQVSDIGHSSEDVARMTFVTNLNDRIDDALKSAFHIHAELERRFFEDARTLLDTLQMEELAIAMKQWRNDDYLVYAILDCIYACHPKYWRSFIGQVGHLILTDAPRDAFLILKSVIVRRMPT